MDPQMSSAVTAGMEPLSMSVPPVLFLLRQVKASSVTKGFTSPTHLGKIDKQHGSHACKVMIGVCKIYPESKTRFYCFFFSNVSCFL